MLKLDELKIYAEECGGVLMDTKMYKKFKKKVTGKEAFDSLQIFNNETNGGYWIVEKRLCEKYNVKGIK